MWTPVADPAARTITTTQQTRALTADEIKASKRVAIQSQLDATDALWQPRWAEDIAAGHTYATYNAWKANRDNLRFQIASL